MEEAGPVPQSLLAQWPVRPHQGYSNTHVCFQVVPCTSHAGSRPRSMRKVKKTKQKKPARCFTKTFQNLEWLERMLHILLNLNLLTLILSYIWKWESGPMEIPLLKATWVERGRRVSQHLEKWIVYTLIISSAELYCPHCASNQHVWSVFWALGGM